MAILNMNQFSKTAIVGQVDLTTNPNPNILMVRFSPESATSSLAAGAGMELVDLGATDPITDAPVVDVIAADTHVSYGVKIYDTKEGAAVPGDIISIALDGAVIYLEASGALARGAAVALDVANVGKITAVGTDAQIGILLDKATADGDIVRVQIKTAAPST